MLRRQSSQLVRNSWTNLPKLNDSTKETGYIIELYIYIIYNRGVTAGIPTSILFFLTNTDPSFMGFELVTGYVSGGKIRVEKQTDILE